MIPSKLCEVLQIPSHRSLTVHNIPEIIKSLQQFGTQQKTELFSEIYPELLRLLLGCHCSILAHTSCPMCVQPCMLDIFGGQKYTGAQIEQFHYLNVLSPLPNLFGYFSQIQIRNIGREQAAYAQNFKGGRFYSSVIDSQEATHFLLSRNYIAARQLKSRDELFPQPHNIYSLAYKFEQKRTHFDNFQYDTSFLPYATRLLLASKQYKDMPALYSSLLKNKITSPSYLNLTAIELYLFELFTTLRHDKPSYSSYLGLQKLAALHFEWSEKLISMEYLKRVNLFIHPLTKLLLQNLLLALDLKLRKENQRILDLMLALFEQFLLQTPIDQDILTTSKSSFKRSQLNLRTLSSPLNSLRKEKFHKPTLVHLECIYGFLEVLSSFPQIYQLVIPSVQNYLAVLLVKWSQLWPQQDNQPAIYDLLPLFMKVIRPWHQNYFFSIQNLDMKTHNFKFGILYYHFKKNLGDKSFILSGFDRLKRRAKTIGASLINRLSPNSHFVLSPQRFESDGASFVYESLKSYELELLNSRGGIAWLQHASKVSFPYAMKLFPLLLRSSCFEEMHLSLRKIEFLHTFIEFIKPDEEGRIFDGYFSLEDTMNHFQNPQDLIQPVLNLQHKTRQTNMVSKYALHSNKFRHQDDELRESETIKRGYRRTLCPFRVELDQNERDEVLMIIKKLEDVKVNQQLKSCLQEVNAKLNKKNIKTLRDQAERVKSRFMDYFKISEFIPSAKAKKKASLKLKRSPSFGNKDEFKVQGSLEEPRQKIVLQPLRKEPRSVWFPNANRNESELVLDLARRCSFLCDKMRGKGEHEYPETNLRFLADRNLWFLSGVVFVSCAWFFL